MNCKAFWGIIAALVSISICSVVWAGKVDNSRKFMVCHAGNIATEAEAKPYIDSFGKYLAGKLGWDADSYQVKFLNKRKAGIKALETWKPAFAALTLSIYLEAEKTHNLKPLVLAEVNGQTSTKYRVLVKKGTCKSIEELKGKTLTGTELEDARFLSKVVFDGKLDASTHFKLKATNRPLRAIRKVARGKADAALVDALQYDSLKELPLFQKVEVIYESSEIPNLGMVYLEGNAKPEEVKKFADALTKMCADPEGKNICQTAKLDSFKPIPSGTIDKVRSLYNKK